MPNKHIHPEPTCTGPCKIFSPESTRSISLGNRFSCSDNPGRRQALAHILNIRYMHGEYRFYLVIAAFSFLNSAKSREKLRAKCVWIAVKCGVDSHLASGRISRVVAAIGAVTPLAKRARGKTLAISTRRGWKGTQLFKRRYNNEAYSFRQRELRQLQLFFTCIIHQTERLARSSGSTSLEEGW